jgi:hypothetical protein
MRRTVALLVVLVLSTLSSLITARPVAAQTTTSVPQFTIKFVDYSHDYYVPPVTTTTTDAYTGNKNSTTQPGYTVHVANQSITITIKNQQFVPSLGNQYLFYNVEVKGHFEDSWGTLYGEGTYYEEESSPQNPSPQVHFSSGNLPQQSNSEYTVLTSSGTYLSGSQVDFRVKAITGYDSQAWFGDPDHPLIFGLGHYGHVIAVNQSSDWSNTQTITIPESSPSSLASPTVTTVSPTQTVSPFVTASPNPKNVQGLSQADFYTAIVVLAAIIVALLVSVALLARKVKEVGLEVKKQRTKPP